MREALARRDGRCTGGRQALLCLLLVGAAIVALAPSRALARAPVKVGDASGPRLGVALAGDRVVWPRLAARYATPVEVLAASAGSPAETILVGDVTPGTAVEQLPVLDASRQRVAVSLLDFVRSESTVRVAAASTWAGSPQAPLARVPAATPGEVAFDVQVDGHRTAWLVGNRTGRTGPVRLVTRDERSGVRRVRRMPRHTAGLIGFAGGYVATTEQRGSLDRTKWVVRSIRAWRVRTQVIVREDSVDVDGALRSDGALALVYGFTRMRAGVVPLGGKRVQLLPGRPAMHRIVFGRRGVVYGLRSKRGTRLIEVGRSSRPRRLTAPVRGLVDFDGDSGRVALRTRGCVYVARVPALDAVPSCP